MTESDRPLLSIDLFCGAGGLSLGLSAAGFVPLLAVDVSDMAAETYYRNFITSPQNTWQRHVVADLRQQIRDGVAVAPTATVLEHIDGVRELLGGRDLDLLAGGPPCQGFSLAGLRNPNDQRNRLPFEFLRFVHELRPRAVLIENVSGIAARFHSDRPSALEELNAALAMAGHDGYLTQIVELDAAHYGVPQHRARIMILALRGDIAKRHAVEPTDDLAGLLRSPRWSSSSEAESPLLAPTGGRSSAWTTSGDALADLNDDGYVHPDPSAYPRELAYASGLRNGIDYPAATALSTAPAAPPNHVLRRHSRRVAARFGVYLALTPYGLRENVFRIAMEPQLSVPDALGRVRSVLESHSVPQPLTLPDGARLIDAEGVDIGINHAALTYGLLSMATGKHSQRALRADVPAPTILSLPDDFVHPWRPRTLTVREMARLQSFPDTFVFFGKETTGANQRRMEVPQYTQVGNAVPPGLASAVGRHLALLLSDRSWLQVPKNPLTPHERAKE